MKNQTLDFQYQFNLLVICLYKSSSLHDIIIAKYSIELIIPRLMWPDELWPEY